MDERKDFIETLQTMIRGLQEDGMITSEQLKEGIEIPLEWFFSRGIDRRILSKTFENICAKINPGYNKALKRIYAIDTVRIIERNGKIGIQVLGRDNWTFFNISDEGFHQKGRIETFDSHEFITELQNTMREAKRDKLKTRFDNLSDEEIQNILSTIYDQRQRENEEKGLAISLSEMIQNFGEYYRYLWSEKEQAEKKDIEVTSGGLIEQDVDQMPRTRTRSGDGGGTPERVNEIYPFEQRDAIFRDLNPMKIISFDSIDEEGRVQKGTYTSYVFTNPRENRGYFIISEPYRGDKSCRGVYLSDKFVEDLNGGEENSNFWVDITRIYLEMSGQEFHDEPSTYTFRHRALEQYAARMKYIISGEIDPNVSKSVIYTAKMNLSKLFGIEMNKQKISEIASEVSREEIDEARRAIMPQTKEQSVGGREE